MKRIETELPGVCVIEPDVMTDERGYFLESYHEDKYRELGIVDRFVQDNHSRSVRGTLRGLHYQVNREQAKLCRVARGEVLDVAVDVRRGSPHFGRFEAVVLSGENRRQIYIPRGFAHGFLVLSEEADFLYKCSDFYSRADERGVRWDDPRIAIPWGVAEPILSAKDRALPLLADACAEDLPVFSS